MTGANSEKSRDVIFISKATPGDDEFVLWLAPRLEAAGYKVFADIVTLEPGDRWRKQITETLQTRAAKMLLCCQDSTLAKSGVQEEIGIAEDLSKELKDPKFIIPLKLKKYKKVFGIGGLQYIDCEAGWATGLRDLLETLKKQKVPRDPNVAINPNWENYRKRLSISIEQAPEVLTSNWLRIAEAPDTIRYFQPTGAVNLQAMLIACKEYEYPAEPHLRGFFSFAGLDEINRAFEHVGRFDLHAETPLSKFIDEGSQASKIRRQEASNMVLSMFRQAWERFCRNRNLYQYAWSSHLGFHVTDNHIAIGKKVPWGRQGENRSSMLRNVAGGKLWQYGVTVIPSFWPFPHFRIKSRVLFAELDGTEAGSVIKDSDQQHRLRRRICKGWRNKQWHGRLMAFLELLSQDSPYIRLPLSDSESLKLDASPILVTSPVTTILPDELSDETEEQDFSTLGVAYAENDE